MEKCEALLSLYVLPYLYMAKGDVSYIRFATKLTNARKFAALPRSSVDWDVLKTLWEKSGYANYCAAKLTMSKRVPPSRLLRDFISLLK